MKHKNKLAILFTTFLMLLSVIAPSMSALAEENEHMTTLRIHKLQAESYNKKWIEAGGKENKDGAEIENFDDLGVKVKPLQDVQFSYIKLTDEITEEILKGMSSKTIMETYEEEVVTLPEKTDSNGLASVVLPDGTYYFFESDKPKNVTSALAVPFVISLPLYKNIDKDGKGTKLDVVNVYPKNITGDEPKVEKDVEEIDNDNANYTIGEKVPWIITADVPTNLKDYVSFKLTDKLDEKLTFDENTDVVKVYFGNFKTKDAMLKEKEVSSAYYSIEKPNKVSRTLTVKLTDDGLKKLNENSDNSKKLYVYYTTTINRNAKMGQEIKNTVELEFENNPGNTNSVGPKTPPTVETGGKKFVKTNEEGNKQLPGAKFLIMSKDKKMYLADAPNNQWKWIPVVDSYFEDSSSAAHIFTSEGNGEFEVKGLKYDSYLLKEIAAPDEYVVSEKPIPFTVTKDSYNSEKDIQQIQNRKKPEIPKTGGIGSAIFIALGLGLMGVAYMKLKETKEA